MPVPASTTYICNQCGLETETQYVSYCPQCGHIKSGGVITLLFFGIALIVFPSIVLLVSLEDFSVGYLIAILPILLGGGMVFGAINAVTKALAVKRNGPPAEIPDPNKAKRLANERAEAEAAAAPKAKAASKPASSASFQIPDSSALNKLGENMMKLEGAYIDYLAGDDRARFEQALEYVVSNRRVSMVEEAIRLRTRKPDFDFYKPQGLFASEPEGVKNQILQLSREGKFTQEAETIQALIPKVAFMNADLMQELAATSPRDLALYQLLGVQLQLRG